jgi:hypothetical protein
MTKRGLKILSKKNIFPGIKAIESKFCKHCIMGRKKIVSFLRVGPKRDTKILYLVHSDVCVPINIRSPRLFSYFATFINDASKKVWDFPIKIKDHILDTFHKFHMVLEK